MLGLCFLLCFILLIFCCGRFVLFSAEVVVLLGFRCG